MIHHLHLVPAAHGGQVTQNLRISRCACSRCTSCCPIDGDVLEVLHRVHLVLRRLRHNVVIHHVAPIEEEHGRHLEAAAQRIEHAGGNVLLRIPALRGLGAVYVYLKSGIVVGLLNADVCETRNAAELGKNLVCLGLACDRIVALNLDVDGRGQSKVENLCCDISGEGIKGRCGKHAGQIASECAYIIRCRPVIGLERYQNVAVPCAQRSVGQVLRVQRAVGQADVVEDVVDLISWYLLTDLSLNQIEQLRGLFNTHSRRRPDMENELPTVSLREKVFTKERYQAKGDEAEPQK